MRGVAIPRARTKYLTLTIGETRCCSLFTRLTSRLENIAASCYLHSPIEPATERGMRVIVSRLPLSPPLRLRLLSLSVARPSVLNRPPRASRLLSVFGARDGRLSASWNEVGRLPFREVSGERGWRRAEINKKILFRI